MVCESYGEDFWGFWFLQIFKICNHQVTWPTSSRTWNITQKILLSALSFHTDLLLTGLSRYLGCTLPVFQNTLMVRQMSSHIFLKGQKHSIAQSHHSSAKPLCTSAIAVTSFTLRTVLSATPFVFPRWGVHTSWFHCWSWHASINSSELSVYFFLASVTEEEIIVNTSLSPMFCFDFIGWLWIQFVKSSCTIRAFLCPHLDSLSTIRKMICRDQIFECWRKCDPIHALLWFYSTPGSCGFLSSYKPHSWGLLENEWTLLWFPPGWEPMIPFLLLASCAGVSPPRIGGNRVKFLIKRSFDNFMRRVTPSCQSWGRCFSFFKSFLKTVVTGPERCPPLLVLAQGFPWLSIIQWMVLPSVG